MRGFFNFIKSGLFLSLLSVAAYLAAIIFLCLYIPTLVRIPVALAGIYALSAAVAFYAIQSRTSPEYKCAWLALIILLPAAGSVIYLITVHAPIKKERALRFNSPIPPQISFNELIYFKDGTGYFKLLFEEIDRAEKFVYLEYYIMAKGVIFERLLFKLKAAAARGVEIKIIIDGLGSAMRLPKRKLGELKKIGAGVMIFHKYPLPPTAFNFRDHRKLAVIDDRVAFIGGINIADEYANICSPHGYWKDVGAAVYCDAEIFKKLFLSVYDGSQNFYGARKGENQIKLLSDSPPVCRGLAESEYARAINSAEREIAILTPYLCVGDRLKSALAYAAKRGVDVKIIIPHVPDKKLTYVITKSFAAELDECGVKIYEYTPGFMHAKIMLCDGEAYLGSYNFDFRSMRINFECGVGVSGHAAEIIKNDFDDCLSLSRRVEFRKKNIFQRFGATVLRLFAPLV